MEIEFDAAKDAANFVKHKISLTAAAALEVHAVVADVRADYHEERFNAYGTISGVFYCLTLTMRGDVVRAISLRRARTKEYRRHVH